VYTLTFIFFLPKNGGNRACSIDEAFPSGMSMHTRASQHRCAFVLLPRSHAAAAGLVLSMLALQAAQISCDYCTRRGPSSPAAHTDGPCSNGVLLLGCHDARIVAQVCKRTMLCCVGACTPRRTLPRMLRAPRPTVCSIHRCQKSRRGPRSRGPARAATRVLRSGCAGAGGRGAGRRAKR